MFASVTSGICMCIKWDRSWNTLGQAVVQCVLSVTVLRPCEGRKYWRPYCTGENREVVSSLSPQRLLLTSVQALELPLYT